MNSEEVVKMLRTIQRTVYLGNRKFEDAIEYAIKALKRSEPLQPEIIKCMECKYYEASIACNPWGVCCHKDWVANSIGHNVDETGWCYRAERREAKQEEQPMHEVFEEGEYIIYQNGDRFELGKIKRSTPDGAFVYYSSGTTAAKTPFSCMHKLANKYVIGETSLGGAME